MKNRKRLLSLVICVALLVCMLPMRASANSDFPTVLAQAKKGVVQIYGLGNDGRFLQSWVGTGFAVGEKGQPSDIFLTNWHVITSSGEYDLDEVRIWILQENCQINNSTGEPDPNKSIACEVLKTTTGYPDYAIIRATEPVTDYLAMPLMSSEAILDGTTVYALGYPAVVGDYSASHYGIDDITATNGIVSQHMQLTAAENTWVLMHTAQISGGNSGGPLITEDGTVVGLNTYGFGGDDGNVNRYCAVYIDYAIEGLDELGLTYDLVGESVSKEDDSSSPTEDSKENDETTDDESENEEEDDKKWFDFEDFDWEEEGWIPIAAAGGAVLIITLVVVLIVLKKKQQEEQRRLEAERRYQAEQRRLEEERRRQEEEQRRQAEEMRRMEEQRRAAQLQKEQEVKAQLQLCGGPTYPVRACGCVIGRDRDCSIVLPENASGVSRHHCKLEHRGGQLILVDLNSTYGTYIHGKRIPANTPVALHAGSSFCLGSEKCKFTVC